MLIIWDVSGSNAAADHSEESSPGYLLIRLSQEHVESVNQSGLPLSTLHSPFLLFLLLSLLVPGIRRGDQAVSFTPRDKSSYLFRWKKGGEIRDALEAVVPFPVGRLSKKRFLPKVSTELDAHTPNTLPSNAPHFPPHTRKTLNPPPPPRSTFTTWSAERNRLADTHSVWLPPGCRSYCHTPQRL